MSETNRNPGGRPRVDATPVTVRVAPEAIGSLDAWVARQREPRPSRPEAIRRLMERGLRAEGFATAGTDAGSIPVEALNASNDE